MSDKPYDFLILGDSHTLALMNGAEKLGYRVATIQFSGAGWHDKRFVIGNNGFEIRAVPAAKKRLDALRAELGVKDVFASGLPVLSTVGFHLGRLTAPIGWNKHRVFQEDLVYEDDQNFMSKSMLRDIVVDGRARHFRLARRLIRQKVPLTIVAPPRVARATNADMSRNIVIEHYRELGVSAYDPQQDIFDKSTGLCPPSYILADGHHGSTAYGAKVIEKLIKRKLLVL
ncbi:hypothetical protein [Celeribacter litoreus]|uniref:hypothetical protein n=1 Tax=Celeribacter litoreus TaxID=2876714 RepID=UPI001CC97BA6|nr:hypothetical protein [Celeribacter litoreus]MCA0045124.1 hypothetical protein [Celeribacter litoreus]